MLVATAGALCPCPEAEAQQGSVLPPSGELKTWHKVTIDFMGPETAETATPNPFTDYRLDVAFTHTASGRTLLVPGYYAADGNAANSSAETGHVWRVHLAPDAEGEWTWAASFRTGANVATSEDPQAGASAAYFDGSSGSFSIAPSDKTGRDMRAKGRLDYVGKHHLRHAGTGRYFMKAGTDSPENLLSYADFDGDFKTDDEEDELVKTYAPHVADWQEGDPVWQGDKGKGLIGAINSLASEGLNAFSFLTMNIEGDDRNVFPYLNYDERDRMDVSRLDQWEIIFEHGTSKGFYLHFKTQETENELMLDNGNMGNRRKLYYRELIARFSHHLALNWNLGEEINNASLAQKAAWAQYFHDKDPYRHPIVIHNGASHFEMMGSASVLTGFSLQMNESNFSDTFYQVRRYVNRSEDFGRPWVIACDEPGDSRRSVRPDHDPGNSHRDARRDALWATALAGGAGCEFYFGYDYPESDMTLQDFRSRDVFWDNCRHFLQFFEANRFPFEEMTNHNELVTANGDNANRCLAKIGNCYLVQLRDGGSHSLDLSGVSGSFTTLWFNPRTGAAPVEGPVIEAGAWVALGAPPDTPTEDWIVLVRSTGGGSWTNYPPQVDAGPDKAVFLNEGLAEVTLNGTVNDDGLPDVFSLTRTWTMLSGPQAVDFSTTNTASTVAHFTAPGAYVLGLVVSDTEFTVSDQVTVLVSQPEGGMTLVYGPADDAYLDDGTGVDSEFLRVENSSRVRQSFLKFDLTALDEEPADAALELTGADIETDGQVSLKLYAAAGDAWSEELLDSASAPTKGPLLASFNGMSGEGVRIRFELGEHVTAAGTYGFIVETDSGAKDAVFASKEYEIAADRPRLIVTTKPNSPPLAAAFTAATLEDLPLVIPLPELLAGSSDPDGDPVSLVAEGGSTSEGGEVTISGEALSYTPPIDFFGPDSFSFLVEDGRGGFASALLTLHVVPSDLMQNQAPELDLSLPPGPKLKLTGVPGMLYSIWRSPDLQEWEAVGNKRAGSGGELQWQDPDPLPGKGFYRVEGP
ncbi:DUF5060 domain-containing protein [Luteolibacter sp. GHJ8]|uniref:DUF5060 domain-containing protein n=1 Tax=Luteolibacter rhizosphaerae TaxID=2989719 RepID=A0ABT3G0J4_9BACT|nr:DUF5060 domain-containing protein [Luteolibacter rhizosphaerae]MCW1913360.1 DUF5060 domain-containing protein [Luteolibacter rhizosphaerae]